MPLPQRFRKRPRLPARITQQAHLQLIMLHALPGETPSSTELKRSVGGAVLWELPLAAPGHRRPSAAAHPAAASAAPSPRPRQLRQQPPPLPPPSLLPQPFVAPHASACAPPSLQARSPGEQGWGCNISASTIGTHCGLGVTRPDCRQRRFVRSRHSVQSAPPSRALPVKAHPALEEA